MNSIYTLRRIFCVEILSTWRQNQCEIHLYIDKLHFGYLCVIKSKLKYCIDHILIRTTLRYSMSVLAHSLEVVSYMLHVHVLKLASILVSLFPSYWGYQGYGAIHREVKNCQNYMYSPQILLYPILWWTLKRLHQPLVAAKFSTLSFLDNASLNHFDASSTSSNVAVMLLPLGSTVTFNIVFTYRLSIFHPSWTCYF